MRVRARHIAGLAFLWPLLTISKTALDGFTNQAGIVGMGPLAFVFSAAMGVVAALVLASPRRAESLLDGRAAVPALGLAASALLAASGLPALAGSLRWAVGLLAAAVCACTLCALTLAWSRAYAAGRDAGGTPEERQREAGAMLVDACASLFLSFGIRLAFALLLGSGALAGLGGALRAAYPLLACLAWFAATRPDCHAAAGVAPRAQADGGEGAHARGLVFAACAFVLLTCVLVGIRAGGTADYPIDVTGARYVLALAFGAVLCALAWVVRTRPGLWLLPWGFALLFVFAGALVTLMSGSALARVGVNAMIAGRLALWALYWTLPAQMRDVTRGVAALYLLPQALAYCLTDALYLVVPAGAMTPVARDVASVALVVALVACALAVANRAGALSPAAEGSSEPAAPKAAPAPDLASIRSAACAQLAERHRLTQRETIVLELVSQGHTVPQIAQEQGVSENTVRTHTKGLYRKLDCHTKQDVMDAVARQMEAASRQA